MVIIMFRIFKYIWDAKVQIAKMNQSVTLKKIAHDAAHNIAMSQIDTTIIGHPRRNYKADYDKEFNRLLIKLLHS
jgi:hypothetical protein